MNLAVLEHLIENEHYIEEKANDSGLDPAASIGIGKKVIGLDGDLTKLSSAQMHHWKVVYSPLLENVVCEGPVGFIEDDEGNCVSSCTGGGYVDDESLLESYLEEDFKCQICRYDSAKMN